MSRALGLALLLTVGSWGLSAVVPRAVLAEVAFAQSVPDGLSKLEQKASDLSVLVQKVLFVFAGMGIAFCGFRFLQGDPHAWRYTIAAIIGSTIIFASAEILQWLQR